MSYGMPGDIPASCGRSAANPFMAIDGVVESPKKWLLSYWNDDIANVVMGGMRARTRCCSAGSVRAIRRGLARPYGRGRSRCGLHEQREEVRGVTHLDQPVPGLMGTPTEVPLVMDAPPERSPLVTTPNPLTLATGCLTARRQGRPPSGRHPAR